MPLTIITAPTRAMRIITHSGNLSSDCVASVRCGRIGGIPTVSDFGPVLLLATKPERRQASVLTLSLSTK